MGQTALVLGATGVVGRELIKQLSLNIHIDNVLALTRRPVKYDSNKVTNYVIDFDQLDQHSALFQVDMVFSCLGTTLKQAGSIAQQRIVDVDYQYVAAMLAQSNGVKHYLLVSSSGANSTSQSSYLKMKGELEALVSALDFEHISIIQPSLLLGDRKDIRLGEKIGARLLPIICLLPGLSKYRPITGQQVAEKMCNIAMQEAKPANSKVQYYRLDALFKL